MIYEFMFVVLEWIAEVDWVMREGANGKQKEVLEVVELLFPKLMVNKVYKDIKSGEQLLDLEMNDEAGNKIDCKLIPSKKIVEKEIVREINRYGYPVYEYNQCKLLKVINTLKLWAENAVCHLDVGYHIINGKRHYLADKVIGEDVIESEYKGDYDLKPKGSFEIWRKLVDDYVIGDAELECAMAIGFSAPIVYLLATNNVDIIMPIFSIVGNSSTGKTTVLNMCASIYGLPNKGDKGLISDYSATSLGLIKQVEEKYGFPLILDEQTMLGDCNMDAFVYEISGGVNKAASTSDGNLRERKTWKTSVISTSESSMFDHLSSNDGLKVRVFEISDKVWTKSAQIAETLNKGFKENYAWAIEPYVKTLFDVGDSAVIEKYDEFKADIISAIKNDEAHTYTKLTDRIAKMMAILVTAAHFANVSMDLGIDIERLKQFLIKVNDKNSLINNEAVTAEQHVKDCIMRDLNKYEYIFKPSHKKSSADKMNETKAWGSKYGYLIFKDSGDGFGECWMSSLTLNKYLKEGGFVNVTSIKAAWKENGFIKECEKGKYIIRKTVNGNTNSVYVFDLGEGIEESDASSEIKQASIKPKVKENSLEFMFKDCIDEDDM